MNLESHPGIPLWRHLNQVAEHVQSFCSDLQTPAIFQKTALLAALGHDLGKATAFFQAHLNGSRVKPWLSAHALLSALLTISLIKDNLPLEWQLPLYLAIKFHHSNITNLNSAFNLKHEWDILEQQIQTINANTFSALLKKLNFTSHFQPSLLSLQKFNICFAWPVQDIVKKQKNFSLYFTTNLILGMLTDADIRSVVGINENRTRTPIDPSLVDRYLNKKNAGGCFLNKLRNEFYTTVITNIEHEHERKIFSLTAPTGLGKTLTGFSAALKLRDYIYQKTGRLARIIYVLPFTSIIEQNYMVLSDLLTTSGYESDIIIKHHFRSTPLPCSPDKIKNFTDIWQQLEENNISQCQEQLQIYEKAHTRVETWDAEIIITTFVRFFETLLTNRRSEMRRLHNLVGSIVILDEVQNIPVIYWDLTEKILQFLASTWDTRFILMTATKPALLSDAFELTTDKKEYFYNALSRTNLIIEPEQTTYLKIEKWLLSKINKQRSFMVILNTIHSAQEIYNNLKEAYSKSGYKLYFLSASLIPIHREKVIKELKNVLADKRQKTGLIATQVVEAGVDLDFDLVIRDFAPLDSVVQAAGRCNRNADNITSNVYLVSLIDDGEKPRMLAKYIYDPVLLETNQSIMSDKTILLENDFLQLVEYYFAQLSQVKNQDFQLINDLFNLHYDKINEFSLITKQNYVPVFVEFDEHATELINKLRLIESMKITSYDDRLTRRQIFKTLAPELWGYVTNVPSKIAEICGATLPYATNFILLERDNPEFDSLYSQETGFTRKLNHDALFL
jgi:CRISPR-associated endonuclease/helicase Cas3